MKVNKIHFDKIKLQWDMLYAATKALYSENEIIRSQSNDLQDHYDFMSPQELKIQDIEDKIIEYNKKRTELLDNEEYEKIPLIDDMLNVAYHTLKRLRTR